MVTLRERAARENKLRYTLLRTRVIQTGLKIALCSLTFFIEEGSVGIIWLFSTNDDDIVVSMINQNTTYKMRTSQIQ